MCLPATLMCMTGMRRVERYSARFVAPDDPDDPNRYNPLVALCDARDEKHRAAVKHVDSLIPNELTVCEAVLPEACLDLPHKSPGSGFML